MLEYLERRQLLSSSVTTFHNNVASTGANLLEVQLAPTNVKVGSFGKRFSTTVDGAVYAQPLVAGGVTVGGATHDVVIVATENDSVYAIDTASGQILWTRSFLTLTNSSTIANNTLGASAIRTVSSADVGSSDISPTIGITGTPVIDTTQNLIYLVTKTAETVNGTVHFVQRLHAIRIADGTDAVTPYLIGDTTGQNTNSTSIYTYGTGDGYVTDPYNGTGRSVVQFNALHEAQRPALSLVNGTVYVAWASHGDNGPYHGFVVTWNVSNISTTGFKLSGVLDTCPNDGEAGIWESGGALVFESNGSAFYFLTGNGSGGAPTLGSNGLPTDANYNEAVVKAVPDPSTTPTNENPNGWGLKVTDFFIPYNVAALDGADSDFGSGGPILLPDSAGISGHPHLLVAGGKDGRLFVLDRDNLGHYNATTDAALNSVAIGNGVSTPPNADGGTLSTPAFYNGKLYVVSGYSGAAYAYNLTSTGSLMPTSRTSTSTFGYLPGSPSVSANGSTNGIVWQTDRDQNVLHAYDANTLSTELWNSAQASGGADALGAVVKFAVPTIANGEVFVGTTNSIVAYGLTPAANTPPQTPALSASALSGTSISLNWSDSSVAPNLATGYSIEESTNGTSFTVVTTAAAGATSIGIGGLSPQTKYYFRIRGFNGAGNSGYSNTANATTTAQSGGLNLSGGFASAGNLLTLNGSAQINGSNLQLTDLGNTEAGSAFSTTTLDVTKFSTQFDFLVSGGTNTADGFTFTLQNVGANALGSPAGGLGYANITKSVAIKFDLYSNSGEGPDSTGLFNSGSGPTSNNSIDLSSTGINLHSGDPIRAKMSYDGTTLLVTLTDLNTNAVATQSYTVNLPTLIGSGTAYAGFTGGTGGIGAVQQILNWTLSPAAIASPGAPSGLGATAASATSVNLNWTNNGASASGFYLDRASDSGFTQSLLTQTLSTPGSTYTDIASGLAPGSTFYYRIRAFNSAGTSGNSNTTSVTIPVAPPKPTNQKVTDVESNEIDISWQDNAGHLADGYKILRAVNHGSFSLLVTLPPTSRTAPSEYDYDDKNLTPNTYYEYHIEAYNVSGNNDFAGVNATTLAGTGTATNKLTGTVIGTTGSYDGMSTREKAFDGDFTTFFDANSANGAWTGLDLGTASSITGVQFAPRVGFESRMVGGILQGSNTADFSSGVTNFFTITATPSDGFTTQAVSAAGTFRYVRYLSPNGSYGNVAEVEFDGSAGSAPVDTQAPTAPGTPTLTSVTSTTAQIAWTASTDNVGVDHYVIFRNGTQVGTSTSLTYTDNGLTAATGYAYTVTAVDAAANVSPGSGTLTVQTAAAASSAKLSGTIIGTAGSYDGTSTRDKAFDGSLTTFFDATGPDGDYVGLDLGSAATVSSISYAPRVGFASRMVGGIFQGSNDATFASGVVTLASVTTTPASGLTTVATNSSAAFRYVRYLAPSGSYGNVAEVQFFGTGGSTTPPPTSTSTQLTGTGIGTVGSYDGSSTFAKALDGNLATFFDAAQPNNDFVGLDLGTAATIGSISYAPRAGFESRMVGGVFQGSNTADFSNAAVLATITATPADSLTSVAVSNATAYRYVRYLAPSGGYGNVAEVQFFGTAATTTPPTTGSKLAGTVIGTAGSYDGVSTIAKVFDGSASTFFDAAGPNGNYVGLDLGVVHTVTSISYTPRAGYESRMVGGIFQTSNTSDFSSGVTTLYTIASAPSGPTTVAITGATSGRYVRYLAPAGSYGNVAELEFDGN